MKTLLTVVTAVFLLTACATTPAPQEETYRVTCKTHAKTATFHGSPDEQGHFLECMKFMGQHDVEVEEIK